MNPSINMLTNEDTTWKSNFIICQYFESTSICLFRNPLFLMHRKVYTTSMRLLIHSHTHIHAYIHEIVSQLFSNLQKGGFSSSRDSIDDGIFRDRCKNREAGYERMSREGDGDRSGERKVVGSSPRHERLASVSFGRNTDRLSKRHEATAKTNLKCLLTKQSELAALPAHEETGCSRRLLLSMAIILHGSLRYRSPARAQRNVAKGAHPRHLVLFLDFPRHPASPPSSFPSFNLSH